MTNKISRPVPETYKISFKFGEAPKWYVDVFGYPHNGLDFACPIGTPVRACDEGVVLFAGGIPDQLGLGIIIQHSWGRSMYWHLSSTIATVGTTITRGSVIGISGATGYVTGPHLHFGIMVYDDTLPGMNGWTDPEKYFESPETPNPEPQPINNSYLVKPGDSLWSIAVKFYRNGLEWPRIYEANKDKISNPNLIRPFQMLIIP